MAARVSYTAAALANPEPPAPVFEDGMVAVWWRPDGWKEIVGFVTPSSFSTDNTRVWARLPERAEVSYSALSPRAEIDAGDETLISANGRWLVSLGTRAAVLSRLPSQDLNALTCETAARNLTEEEWKTYFPGQRSSDLDDIGSRNNGRRN